MGEEASDYDWASQILYKEWGANHWYDSITETVPSVIITLNTHSKLKMYQSNGWQNYMSYSAVKTALPTGSYRNLEGGTLIRLNSKF